MSEQDITNIVDIIVIVLVIILILILYFLPSVIARVRKHSCKWAIFFLNLFTGLTGFGWVAAFVWAFTNNSTARKPTIAEELKELAQLKGQGIISEEEFEVKKSKLLNS
jgi:hypothetical protein